MENPDQEAAVASLAEVEQQRAFVAQRLGTPHRLHALVGLGMGVAVASLAFRNLVVVGVASLAYLVGLVALFGIPARAGVVPRDTTRSLVQLVVSAGALLGIFTVGLLGQQQELRWLPVAAGVLAAVAAVAVGRWRFAELRRTVLGGPGPGAAGGESRNLR